MFVRRSLIVLALTLAVVRCTDQPTALQRSPHVPQFVRWAANVAPQFTAISPQSNQHGRPGFRTPPLSLDTYSVSFWAVRGESRSVQINYSSAIDPLTHPFMQLTVTDPTFAPGQGDIAVGDSVLVTVNIDTTKIGLTLERSCGSGTAAPSAISTAMASSTASIRASRTSCWGSPTVNRATTRGRESPRRSRSMITRSRAPCRISAISRSI